MAIYSAVPPPPEMATNNGSADRPHPHAIPVQHARVDIDAWTISALQSLSISPVARGTGSPLTIPIDEHKASAARTVAFTEAADAPIRRPPSRRDSQRHREALLKGKEGSRQRRRWENDRLIGVPNAQPPQPTDWEVRPTHRIHHVPYHLAQFWDRGVRQRVEDKTSRLAAVRKQQQRKTGSATGLAAGEVPRDLRETAKRSPVVRGWARALEEPVRAYLVGQRQREDDAIAGDSAAEEMDSEDEELVFVGRDGAMRELREKREGWKMARREVAQETVDSGMVFDSLGNDETAAVKRWLVHIISDYYGLESRSVTLPNPSRRVVYVGLKQVGQPAVSQLPRPIWELC